MANAEILIFVMMSLVSGSFQGDGYKPNYNPKTDNVVELTQKNFKTHVFDSGGVWVVVFDFPGAGCKYCIQLSEMMKKAVPLLKEHKMKVGFVDSLIIDNKKLVDSYGIKVFPTVYIFGYENNGPFQFPYIPSSVEDLVNVILYYPDKPQLAEGTCAKDTPESFEFMYELTDNHFEEVVLKCDEPWIVTFYTELCTPFISVFNAAADRFGLRAKFGYFYQGSSKIAEKYNAKSRVCTVKLFPEGNKNRKPIDYNDGIHTINANLVPWIKNTLAANIPAPGINELTSQKVLDSKCKTPNVTTCIFLFFANDNRCNGSCQRTYLDLLKKVANDTKDEAKRALFWTTEGKQSRLEKTFEISSFPAVVIVFLGDSTFSTRGTTSIGELKEFIRGYGVGKLRSLTLPIGELRAVKA